MKSAMNAWWVLAAGAALSSGACSVIVGTDDYRPCEGAECTAFGGGGGAGGAGGASASSGSSSASSSSASGGGDCVAGFFPVTVIRNGDVEIRTEPEGNDFYDGNADTQCVKGGPVTFDARCEGSGNNPLAVTWGNDACGAAPSVNCSLAALAAPQTFTVTPTGTCPED